MGRLDDAVAVLGARCLCVLLGRNLRKRGISDWALWPCTVLYCMYRCFRLVQLYTMYILILVHTVYRMC